MKKEEFCEVLGDIDESYVEEAGARRKGRGPGRVNRAAAAAALAAVLFVTISVLPSHLGRRGAVTPERPTSVAGESPDDGPGEAAPTASAGIRVSMGDVSFNEVESLADAARLWRDPELYDSIHWDRDEAAGYYGRDLAPAYVPEGLTAAPGNGGASAVADKSGEIVEDIAWLGFYHDYYGDGSPKLTEEVPAHRGFSLTVSRTGLLNDCLYILPENEVKTSDICGTAVTFGYRPMPYGPYDPDTHEPSGYYDLYVAEFECDGIECQIVAEQMEAEEVVKVVASIICGEVVGVDG